MVRRRNNPPAFMAVSSVPTAAPANTILAAAAALLVLSALAVPSCSAFSSITHHNQRQRTTAAPSSHTLNAVSKRQVAVIDGAELASIESFLAREDDDDSSSGGGAGIGYMTVVAGTDEEDGRRVVGVEVAPNTEASNNGDAAAVSLDSNTNLHPHTVATIPTSITDSVAISTVVAALVGVHCGLPRVLEGGVGGATHVDSGDNLVGWGKAVVLGGGEYAAFAADGLAALGADVTLVSTGNPKTNIKGVKVMKPAVGNEQIGFADSIGQFDSIVDTLYDEGRMDRGQRISNIVDNLKLRHKCDTYVSTYSESQRIIRKKGLLFGRGDAKDYVVNAMTKSIGSGRGVSIVPPKNFGTGTVQKLFDSGVTFSSPGDEKKDVVVRDWSLKDFWEYTSWPRDAESDNTRFGLPVTVAVEEEDEEEEYEDAEFGEAEAKEIAASLAARPSPYVLEIKGVEGLNREIVGPRKKHAILFLSATWCRTCKYLKPKYSKMARDAEKDEEEAGTKVTYAQADTTGIKGKMLSKSLDVEAVPTFVMFRDGKMYGEPLSISKLPSKQLDLATDYLISGRDYDGKAIREAKEA